MDDWKSLEARLETLESKLDYLMKILNITRYGHKEVKPDFAEKREEEIRKIVNLNRHEDEEVKQDFAKNREEAIRKIDQKQEQIKEALVKQEKSEPLSVNERKNIAQSIYKNKAQEKEDSSEEALNILPIMALICFVLAGIFMANLAYASGWLTPFRQWTGIIAFGGIMCGLSLFLERIEKNYRTYLASAGVILLYIGAYTSYLYFNILSMLQGQIFAAFISFFCLYLVRFFNNELFVAMSAIGTYLSVLFLRKEVDLNYLSGFVLIWGIIFSQAAIVLKSRLLMLISAYLGLGVYAYLNMQSTDYYAIHIQEFMMVVGVQVAQFIIFTMSTFFYSLKHETPLTKEESFAFFPLLMLFYGTTYYFISSNNAQIAPWISLIFAAFLYLIYMIADRKMKNVQSKDLVYGFISVILFHSFYLNILPLEHTAFLLPVILVFALLGMNKDKISAIPIYFKVLFGVIAFLEFIKICFVLVSGDSLASLISAALTVAVALFYYLRNVEEFKVKENVELYLGTLHGLGILTLYRLAEPYGSFWVSVLWGTYSLCILFIAMNRRDALLAKSSLVIIGVTAIKALTYDTLNSASFVRILTLIFTGIVLYSAGYLLKQINSWTKK